MSIRQELGKVSVTPKGEWGTSVGYAILDIVSKDGCSYIARQNVPSGTPLTNNAYWMEIAGPGPEGPIGPQPPLINELDSNSLIKAPTANVVRLLKIEIDDTQDSLLNLDQEISGIIENKADNSIVDALNLRVDNLVIPLSPENSNIEVTDAKTSLTKDKSFSTIGKRMDEMEGDVFLPIENLLNNGDFSLGFNDWVSVGAHNAISVDGGALFNGTATTSTGYYQEKILTTGNKIALTFQFEKDGGPNPNIWVSDYGSYGNFVNLNYQEGQNIVIMDAKNNGVRIYLRQEGGSTYQNAKIKNMMLLDLTEEFGAGKEPNKELIEKVINSYGDGYFPKYGNVFKAMVTTIVENYNKEEPDIVVNDRNLKDKKILVIGDSISTDAYAGYKKWVTNLIDDGFFDVNKVTNNSQHATGFVANTAGNQKFLPRLQSITNKETYDLVIIFGGINDFIQGIPMGNESGNANTEFIPAVNEFFNYLINNFAQARIVYFSPLKTYRIYPNTAGNTQEVYMDYLKSAAKKLCIPTLNLSDESGFAPFIETFKNTWTLVPPGFAEADGVHPNAIYSQEFLAPMIKNFLLKFFY